MNRQSKVRKALARVLSLVAVGAVAVVATPAAATAAGTFDFGYEKGFEGWTPKTDETAGQPDCGGGKHDSTISVSTDKPHTGSRSVDFTLRSPHDCGLAYIDRPIDVGTTSPVTVDLSFWLWSPDYQGGTGGTFAVLAQIGTDCITDPEFPIGGWVGFADLGSTGHADGPGWYKYTHRAKVTPNAAGTICVAQAIKLSSTTGEAFKHYYVDDTKIVVS